MILTSARWERIRMALDAWPRLVDHLTAENDRLRQDRDRWRSAAVEPPLAHR